MPEDTTRTFHFTVTGDLTVVPLDLQVAGHKLGAQRGTPGYMKEELDKDDVSFQGKLASLSSSTPEAALSALLEEALALGLKELLVIPGATLEVVQADVPTTPEG